MNASPQPARPAPTRFWLIATPLLILLLAGLIWRGLPRNTRQPALEPARFKPEGEERELSTPILPEKPEAPPKVVPAKDPRLDYRGPFKNVRPDVAYVDDATCTKCHAEIAASYAHHPMANTLTPIGRFTSPPLDAEVHNPFSALGQKHQVVSRETGVFHTRSAADESGKTLFRSELAIHYAVGSGVRAHSFLSAAGSSLLQSPITWYSQKKTWDLSPRFNPEILAGRRVGADCLFCHSNGASEDQEEETRYLDPIFPNGHGIGCQRCHGPGAEHLKNPGMVKTEAGLLDPTIVNPAHLSPKLRDDVCWQCHLEGKVRVLARGRARFDFRPGLPLSDFVDVFDEPADATYDHVVNHVEQMLQSRCYQRSAGSGQLGCTSCHDAHETPPAERQVVVYRTACLKCHEDRGCSLPPAERLSKSADDSCVSCHMPRFATSDVAHVSSTDHRIPRKPVPLKKEKLSDDPSHLIQELVSVFERKGDAPNPERNRNRALAGGILARQRRYMARPLLPEFEEALRRDPADLPVRTQYALELINRGNSAQAIPHLEAVLTQQPNHEWGLFGMAVASDQLGRREESPIAWRRLVALAPSQFGFRLGLADALMKEDRLEEAEQTARAWVAYDPGSPEARVFLGKILERRDKFPEANEQQRISTELARLRAAAELTPGSP